MSPVRVCPALTPSTTTTATESFGSCKTQWIMLAPSGNLERADKINSVGDARINYIIYMS
jgi:hypothetical protein